MGRLGTTLLKGVGALVLFVILLGVLGTILSIVVSVISTIISLLTTLAFLAVLALAAYGLVAVLWGSSERETGDTPDVKTGQRDDNPVDRLHSRYVNGEISEMEFERRLERQLDTNSREDRPGDRSHSRERTDRTYR